MALFVVACMFIVSGLFMLTFAISQVNRSQQVAASLVQTQQRAEVLMIASYDDADSATQMQRDGVIDLLERSSVAVDVEYLDVCSCSTNRNVSDTSTYGASLVNSDWGQALIKKIADHGGYSAVICIDDDALYFVEAAHDSLFSQMPVVFVGVNDALHAQHVFDAGYATGVVEGCDVRSMLSTARTMRPDATRLLVLTDDTATGLGDQTQFKQAVSLDESLANLSIEYINASSISRAELGKQLSLVGDDTIVVYLDAATDASGSAYTSSQTAYFVSHAAAQPVFAVRFGGVGEGFLASSFVDYEKAGQRAGEIVVMILNGTQPAEIPVERFTSDGLVLDSGLLSNYHIAASTVPTNATLLNQSGLSLDALRPIILPITLLVLGIACILAFAILGYRRTATDMAEVVAQRNILEQRFYTDNLTDMPNMQWLAVYAGSEESSQVRSIVEIVLQDIDKMDEMHGVGTANEIEKTLASRLAALDSIFVVHPSSGEFILGIDRELKRNAALLGKIVGVLKKPTALAGKPIKIDTCVGVFNRERGMSIEEMVSGVDIAIRQAKQVGMTGEIVFYDDEMRRSVEHKLEITQRLKESIDRDDFIVVYQPQIELATNEVVGYEALVRMRGDFFSPEQFIPVAEANGQIVEIDRIVTRKVVQQLATWKKRKQRLRPVSINYSSAQLRDDHYVAYVTALLDEHGVQHELMRMDIRETIFLNNMQKATEFVDELRKVGFGIAIDGFGAGYNSVSGVMQIPADVVKIDRALTAAFLAGDDDDEMISSLVRLVHSANKIVVIEGVETAEQLKRCRDTNCDVVQGFYFSEPLLPEQAVRYKPAPVSDPVPDAVSDTVPDQTLDSNPAPRAVSDSAPGAVSDPTSETSQ